MRILFISRPKNGEINPFVLEQGESIQKMFSINVDYYLIQRGGLTGYLKASLELAKIWDSQNYALFHVHNGLSSLTTIISKIFTKTQSKVVCTFHGTDINSPFLRLFSLAAAKFSDFNIIVSSGMEKFFKNKYQIIPCGIDTDVELDKREFTREKYGWDDHDFVILFSSGFDKEVKDPAFAFDVIKEFSKTANGTVKFVELKGYSREEANGLMQAADVLLMCSKSEGSPQVIKEAILNKLPIISNQVGDVSLICGDTDNCFIIPKEVKYYSKTLDEIFVNRKRIQDNSSVIENYDNRRISKKIFLIYQRVLNNVINSEI